MPAGHGRDRGLELELLDPADEDEVTLLIEARHAQFAAALRCGQEMIIEGEAFSPRLHVAMHQTVANQLLADDPPETWQTVQRLAGMGYDWRITMRMIATLISDGLYRTMHERWRLDPADYARRLHELPGDWPSPQAHRPYRHQVGHGSLLANRRHGSEPPIQTDLNPRHAVSAATAHPTPVGPTRNAAGSGLAGH